MGAPKVKKGLGYYNLESFNLALLIEQIWRIITRPSSLIALVLKEKYFKFLDALEARAPCCG